MLKHIMRRVRAISLINRPVTSTVKAACRFIGATPESFVNHLIRVGPVHSVLPNRKIIKFNTRGDDWISNQVFWKEWNGYESETSSIFFRLAVRSKVVIDVGAHIGYYSILASLANPDCKVFAFEPMPRTVLRFKENLAKNNITNVELIEYAVGDKDGEAAFYCYSETNRDIPSSSGLSKEFGASGFRVGRVIKTAKYEILAECKTKNFMRSCWA